MYKGDKEWLAWLRMSFTRLSSAFAELGVCFRL